MSRTFFLPINANILCPVYLNFMEKQFTFFIENIYKSKILLSENIYIKNVIQSFQVFEIRILYCSIPSIYLFIYLFLYPDRN